MGFQNVHFVSISVSEPSALGLRFLKRSHPFFPVAPRRPPRPPVESATWGSDVELEATESEQTGLAFSLPPSPKHVRLNLRMIICICYNPVVVLFTLLCWGCLFLLSLGKTIRLAPAG